VVSRPPVASERLALTASGQVRYTLKTPYRDGTTHIVLEPLDLMARLAERLARAPHLPNRAHLRHDRARAHLLVQQMWSPNDGPYRGKHYQLEETLCIPQPLSRPRPPILIAGGGEKKTLRLVAQYADACNVHGPIETVRAKLAILRTHCSALGRDYDSIEKTTLGTVEMQPGKMSASEVIPQCKALADAGVQQAIFNMPNVHEMKPLEIFGNEIIPAVSAF
jgi:alkanesulfonate monooxygenase